MKKNNDNLKLTMLPKTKKIILFTFLFSCFIGIGLTKTETASAQACPAGSCSMLECYPVVGCADPGAVFECAFGGWRECVNGSWVETDKRTPTLDLYQINPWGSSLERFQEALIECGETGKVSLECFTGGAETLVPGAATGIMPNIIHYGNTALLGRVNPPGEAAASRQTAPQGAIKNAGALIAGMYSNPPASSKEYLADLGQNLGIIPKPAYAQGTGFAGLNPILGLWKTMRNIAYLFFVIIFVFVGFAIMFRVKIDPQTVISIQTALPKLVIALILVTFSYAIAGLLIDLMYVFIALLFALFQSQLSSLTATGQAPIQELEDLLGHNLFTAFWYMLGGWQFVTTVASGIYDLVFAFTNQIPLISNALGSTTSAIATLIFAIAIAFSMFKLFFTLLISFISIIMGVIFSPLMLMLEAIPGQRGLGNWFKLMLSNIIVFPLTAAIFILGAILVHSYERGGEPGWVAPFLGAGWGTSIIAPLIGMGIVLLAPSIVETAKKAIGAPGVAGLAAGITAPFAGAGAVVTAPIRYVTSPILEASQKARGEAMAERLKLPGHKRLRRS